ncbi:MAG: phosphoribosylaminoimidazolesuccinocarboxamide synthase [Pseudomonadota bacterium]|jgi:phosphoribosylaminoimidazole-succinocarboxamide synthase
MTGQLLYEGKAKKIFDIPGEPQNVLMEFKDSLTAFNAQKKGSFESKGVVNRDIAAWIFKFLETKGVKSHFIENIGERSMKTRRVEIVPLEVVIRNTLAGSTAKKMGKEEGELLKKPLVEFYFKKDELNDPFVSDDQILAFSIADEKTIAELKRQALLINSALLGLFESIGIKLVDFKVEFGKTSSGEIMLADEITPDCCRLWDLKTGEKMDKDRFRRDLGNIDQYYHEVLQRLNKRGGV